MVPLPTDSRAGGRHPARVHRTAVTCIGWAMQPLQASVTVFKGVQTRAGDGWPGLRAGLRQVHHPSAVALVLLLGLLWVGGSTGLHTAVVILILQQGHRQVCHEAR